MQTFLKPFSAEEERYYLQLLQSDVEEEKRLAKEKLIMHNLRLVAHISKKYQGPIDDMEDYISIGTIGLMKAIDSFNPQKGRLATYACRCIENELLMMLRSKKKTSKEVSLYEPIGTDKEGNEIKIYDLCMKQDDLQENLEKKEQIEFLFLAMDRALSERQKDIIIRRYGLYGCEEQTQQEIGDVYGLSRSFISRIEKKALECLRNEFFQIGV
ncbi:MAG: sigma-70 family RNA polymerase sigma factor [Lachnospiraceae bacterium]